MNSDSPIGFGQGGTAHVIIELPNGAELEHKKVPLSESFWGILLQFQSQFNHNLCRRYNTDNRFELPQLIYNNLPFASTLPQLLSTKLLDIAKHRKKAQSQKEAIRFQLKFVPQAFNINELEQRVSKIEHDLKQSEKANADSTMQIDAKNDDMDEDDEDDLPAQQKSGLDADFAKDIDPKQAQSTEETFRKMEILLYKLCKLLATKQVFMSCMKLLRRIVNNLVAYPLHGAQNKDKDPSKYRKLNLNNEKLKSGLFQYEPALDLLLLIGFVKQSTFLVMPAENENSVIFQALVIKIDNCQPPKAALVEVDKEVKIYEMSDVQKFKVQEAAIIAQQQAEKNKDGQSDAALSVQHRKAMQNAYKRNHPTQLMGKELREKKYGVKQKEYRFTVIRIEFPSHKVLEAKFNPNVPIFKLFEFVESMLDENARKLEYQLKLPPSVVIKNKRDENQTFKSMGGMIPACTIRFVLRPDATYNGRFIKQEMVDKYLTTEVTSLRADKLNNVLNGDDEQKSNDDNKNGNSNADDAQKKAKLTKAQVRAMQKQKSVAAQTGKNEQMIPYLEFYVRVF